MIRINSSIFLRDDELEFEFLRASGPGGQNVNKVATAVQLRFDVFRSASLPAEVRRRLTRLAGKRLSKEGILLLQAKRFRTQEQNRADAVERLRELIARAAAAPKRRTPTRPTKSSKERRLKNKHRAAEKKAFRLRRFAAED